MFHSINDHDRPSDCAASNHYPVQNDYFIYIFSLFPPSMNLFFFKDIGRLNFICFSMFKIPLYQFLYTLRCPHTRQTHNNFLPRILSALTWSALAPFPPDPFCSIPHHSLPDNDLRLYHLESRHHRHHHHPYCQFRHRLSPHRSS